MDFRNVVLVGLLSGAALLSATSSCSSADPQTINFSERPRGPGEQASGGPVVTADGGGGGEAGPAEAGVDSGASGGAITAFTGAKVFNPAGQPVGDTAGAGAGHNFAGNTPVTNPAGQNCMTCHNDGGGANAKWGVAGTVYSTAAGATPVKGAEVRIVDAKGAELALVYTDLDGNFWSDTIVGGLPGGALAGVRNAAGKMQMSAALTTQDAGCASKTGCHVQGATPGRIYIK